MNILISSAGTRNKVVQYFKKEMAGKVVAVDCSNLGPAIYDADKCYVVPRIDDPSYIDTILDICKKEDIQGIFALIDPELSLLAKNYERFAQIGVTPIVSTYELCETSLDKHAMYEMLQKLGIPTAKCYMSIEEFEVAREAGEIDFPVFVKPVKGSASLNISCVNSMEMLKALFHDFDGLMIQELGDYRVNVSAGAVIRTKGGETSFDSLYRQADSCVYKSKEIPGCILSFYSEQ